MKKLALALLILLLAPLAAAAQIIGSYPYTFTNGTLADANQVMSNFNYITTQVNANVCATGGCTFTGGIFGTTATFSGALSAGAISGTTGTFSGAVGITGALTVNEASSWAGAQAEAKSTQWALSGYSTATTGYGAGILRIDNTGSNLLSMYYGASTQVGYFYTDGTNLKLGTPTFYLSGALSAGGAISGSTGTFSGAVSAASFSGPLTGNVTGNVTGSAGSATTATNLSGGSVSATTGTFSSTLGVTGTLTGSIINATTEVYSPAIYVGSSPGAFYLSPNGGSPLLNFAANDYIVESSNQIIVVANGAGSGVFSSTGLQTLALTATTGAFSGAITGASYSGGAISGTTGTFSGAVGITGALTVNEASSWAGAQAEAKSTQWALSGYSTATTGYGAGILRIDNTGSNLLAMYYGASTQVGYFYTDGTNLKLGTPTFYLSGALSAGGAISGSTGTFSSTGTFYGQPAATVQASSSDPGHAGGIIYTSGACPTLTTGAICFQTN